MEMTAEDYAALVLFNKNKEIVTRLVEEGFKSGESSNLALSLGMAAKITDQLKTMGIPATVVAELDSNDPSYLNINTKWDKDYAESLEKYGIELLVK